MTDLGVARLIGLDARQRLLEQVVIGGVRQSGQGHELEVGEAGLEHEVELDGHIDGVGGNEHVVEEVPGGDHHPLVGVVRPVRPVEVAVETQHVVADASAGSGYGASRRGHPAWPSSATRCRDRSGPSGARPRGRRTRPTPRRRCGT